MSEEKNNSNNDSSRGKINEQLKKVKDENVKKPGFLDFLRWTLMGPHVTCYTIILPPSTLKDKLAKHGDSETCPNCHVKLDPDPEEKYDFRCPKCKKGFNYSDLTDSK